LLIRFVVYIPKLCFFVRRLSPRIDYATA